MSTPDVLREIRRATRPYGVTAAHNLNLTGRQRQHACANGVLERPYPGVLIDPATARTPHPDLLAPPPPPPRPLPGGRMDGRRMGSLRRVAVRIARGPARLSRDRRSSSSLRPP